MKLFKIEVTTTRRRAFDVLAHAESAEQAVSLVQSKFVGCQISPALELPEVPKHFVLAELEARPEAPPQIQRWHASEDGLEHDEYGRWVLWEDVLPYIDSAE